MDRHSEQGRLCEQTDANCIGLCMNNGTSAFHADWGQARATQRKAAVTTSLGACLPMKCIFSECGNQPIIGLFAQYANIRERTLVSTTQVNTMQAHANGCSGIYTPITRKKDSVTSSLVRGTRSRYSKACISGGHKRAKHLHTG
jgi:hypothetical protein